MTATEAREELKAGKLVKIISKPAEGTLCKLRKKRSQAGEFDVYTRTPKGRWEKTVSLESFLYRYGSYTFEKMEGVE